MQILHNRLFLLVLLINTAGLLGYFFWLVFGHHRILYTQDGVLFLLPCLPFFFVYVFIFRGGRSEPDYHDDDE